MKLNQPILPRSAWLATIGWQLISLAADEHADNYLDYRRELPMWAFVRDDFLARAGDGLEKALTTGEKVLTVPE